MLGKLWSCWELQAAIFTRGECGLLKLVAFTRGEYGLLSRMEEVFGLESDRRCCIYEHSRSNDKAFACMNNHIAKRKSRHDHQYLDENF